MDHVLHEIDPRFADVRGSLYGEPRAEPPFKTVKHKLNLLVSSPNARVFYHFDVPGQTQVQLRGRKRIWISPPTAPFLRAENIANPAASHGVRPIERPVPAAQAQA